MNCLWLWLVVLNLFLVAAEDCSPYNNKNCSICTENEQCYWCAASQKCSYWEWGYYPKCKGQDYYYGQCNVNGLSFILLFVVALLLILFVVVCCCVCCCYCYIRRRRTRRGYSLLESPRPSVQERQMQFQGNRSETRLQNGLDSSDATV